MVESSDLLADCQCPDLPCRQDDVTTPPSGPNSADTDWIVAASEKALEFLATLASDEPDAATARARAFDRLLLDLDDPAKFHTVLYCLVWIAHCMRTSASGDTEPGIWTFEVHTPLGRVPIDQAAPAVRWVSRWLIACMNGDSRAAADLWFGSPTSEAEAKECMNMLVGPLLAFLHTSVREFLAAGRPLVLQGLDNSSTGSEAGDE
ncbi:hypothetical protein [Nocardioides sp.]|uniref:hypothetical protein n=1 Tax=Nocardioides sp. TaxID=35761 RepID=UPI00261D96BE|nr:hypothetical protein [Nocardioides sp.]